MRTAEGILIYLAELILFYMEELKEANKTDSNQFCYGEKTAYIECFELICCWNKAEEYGLNFNIEDEYPL